MADARACHVSEPIPFMHEGRGWIARQWPNLGAGKPCRYWDIMPRGVPPKWLVYLSARRWFETQVLK